MGLVKWLKPSLEKLERIKVDPKPWRAPRIESHNIHGNPGTLDPPGQEQDPTGDLKSDLQARDNTQETDHDPLQAHEGTEAERVQEQPAAKEGVGGLDKDKEYETESAKRLNVPDREGDILWDPPPSLL